MQDYTLGLIVLLIEENTICFLAHFNFVSYEDSGALNYWADLDTCNYI